MKVLISGGGTGGHIYPALAIAKGLQASNPGTEVLYVGTSKGLEAKIVPQEGLPFRTITVEGLPRKVGLSLARSLVKMIKGFLEANRIIRDFRPDAVVGTGGYVCGPVVLAAAFKKIPTLIHEQNAFPGITNKFLANMVDRVAVTFPESVRYFKKKDNITVTGLPIRPEIFDARPEEAESLGFLPDKFNILVVGGSRGARSINLAMGSLIKHFGGREDVRALIVSGEAGYKELQENLKNRDINLSSYQNISVNPYLHRMPEALAAASLTICRAGATTLAEITAKGIPSILIPYPHAAENHQEYNARALVDRDAAILIKDSELDGDKLVSIVDELLMNPRRLQEMESHARELGKPDALKNIIKMVQNLVK